MNTAGIKAMNRLETGHVCATASDQTLPQANPSLGLKALRSRTRAFLPTTPAIGGVNE